MSFKDIAVFVVAVVALLSLGDLLGSAYTGAQTMACDAAGCIELCNRDLDCAHPGEACCDGGLYGYCAASCDKSRTLELKAGLAPSVEKPIRVPGPEVLVYRVLMVLVVLIAAAYFVHRSRHQHRKRMRR